eukprot:2121510-Rhodomonas_salina.3
MSHTQPRSTIQYVTEEYSMPAMMAPYCVTTPLPPIAYSAWSYCTLRHYRTPRTSTGSTIRSVPTAHCTQHLRQYRVSHSIKHSAHVNTGGPAARAVGSEQGSPGTRPRPRRSLARTRCALARI